VSVPAGERDNVEGGGSAATARLILFGGELTTGKGRAQRCTFFNDTFVFSVAEHRWRRLVHGGGELLPAARSAHHAGVVGGGSTATMWTFGGECSNAKMTSFRHHDDLWCFDLATNRWQPIKATGQAPGGRSGARMVSISGSSFLLFGGFADTGKHVR
jgi:N-acetylneuraminic acid mutarotase